MSTQSVKLIYASATNGVIGREGKIPWFLPEDLAVFKEKTLYSTVLMGRKTYESLPPSIKPLPNRNNVVVSRNKDLKIKGVKVINDPVDFIFRSKEPVWVIGGSELYNQVHHLCDEVHHTEIKIDVDGDTSFNFNTQGWDLSHDSGDLVSKTGIDYRIRKWSIPILLNRY